MTPVQQTIFGPERGNCLQAAVASLFDLPLDDVPHFIDEGNRWWIALQDWLRPRGLHCVYSSASSIEIAQPGYYLMVGKSPRHDQAHVVIAKDGEMVHDPHPDGTGLEARLGEYIMAHIFADNPKEKNDGK